jgi:hypothetical protein
MAHLGFNALLALVVRRHGLGAGGLALLINGLLWVRSVLQLLGLEDTAVPGGMGRGGDETLGSGGSGSGGSRGPGLGARGEARLAILRESGYEKKMSFFLL